MSTAVEMTGAPPQALRTPADITALRRDFPILGRAVRGKQLVYLDNAANNAKSRVSVIEAERRYYEEEKRPTFIGGCIS